MFFTLAVLTSLLSRSALLSGLSYSTSAEARLDLLMPINPVRRPIPLIVMIHGGAWMTGSRHEMTPLAADLAGRGVAVANIDYRLAPTSKWPAMLEDCQDAVVFLRTRAREFGIDPKRVGAIGISSGAHLALMLGFRDAKRAGGRESSRVSEVVDLFGPTDFTHDFSPEMSDLVSVNVLGKRYSQASKEAKEFSPIASIDSRSAGVYAIHGLADELVPFIQSERLGAALGKAGKEFVLDPVPGMGHAATSPDFQLDGRIKHQIGKSMDWLVERLSKEPVIQNEALRSD